MNTIESRVKEIVHTQLGMMLGIGLDDVKLTDNFADDLGADSLDEIEMVMAIEDEFEIQIGDDEASKIKTVQQAIDYVTANGGK